MNQWANTVLTNKGAALLAKLAHGNTLNITRAVTGAGFVTPGLLTKQTNVTNPKQELAFKSVSYPENGKCAIPVSLKNDALDAGYEATQIGLYAADPDEGEILLIISQAPDANSRTIVPSATEMPGYSADWTFYLQYGQADGVTVTVDPTGTVSREEMEQALSDKAPTQFVMTLTYGEEGDDECTINKTFAELQAAYQAGSQIRLVDTSGMEYELLAFGANYMAYFAHQLMDERYIVAFRANNTCYILSDLPFSKKNPPTAAQVGAAPSSHNQAASTITAGTLGGQVKANATAAATVGIAQVRDISAGTEDMTPGSSPLPTGSLYFVYE